MAGAQPATSDLAQLILNRTWSPAMEVIGADGFPSLATAGNVLRPVSSFKVSMRLPPTLPGKVASDAIKRALEQVSRPKILLAFIFDRIPPITPTFKFAIRLPLRDGMHPNFLQTLLKRWMCMYLLIEICSHFNSAARGFFDGKPPVFLGEGGSIPFMGMSVLVA